MEIRDGLTAAEKNRRITSFKEACMKREVKRKDRSLLSITVVIVALLFTLSTAGAWETKDPQLAADWEKMMGFKAPDVVGKVAPEIKAGMVIDSSNYQQFPGIKELVPECIWSRFDKSAYAPVTPIKVAKTDQYHLSRGFLEKSLLTAKTAKIAADGITLEGYQGGFPFIHPKNGTELVQWMDNDYLGDSFAMRPMQLRLYNSKNQPEREIRQNLNVLRYKGCTDWKQDETDNPDNIMYVVSGTFIYPRDLSGTAYVRYRYQDAAMADQFQIYIPSMRRIRRMSGRDTQDPLFGCDLTWDDYNFFWQKLSKAEFPNEYKLLGEGEQLAPTAVDYNFPDDRKTAGYTDYYVDDSGDQAYLYFGSYQRRPAYFLEIKSLDTNYVYSKRVISIDKETGLGLYSQMYDPKGKLWRSITRNSNLSQEGKGLMEDLTDLVDHINNHRTIIEFKGHRNPEWMGKEYSDVRFLSKGSK